jgi:hypothetical protein
VKPTNRLGQLAEARQHLGPALATLNDVRHNGLIGPSSVTLPTWTPRPHSRSPHLDAAWAFIRSGCRRIETARAYADAAVALAQESGYRHLEAYALTASGTVELAAGRPNAAAQSAERAVSIQRSALGLVNVFGNGRPLPCARHRGRGDSVAEGGRHTPNVTRTDRSRQLTTRRRTLMRAAMTRPFRVSLAWLLLATGLTAGLPTGPAMAHPDDGRKQASALLGDWADMGHANYIVGLAANSDGYLYAADRYNQLWRRDEFGSDQNHPWTIIGQANDVVALAASNTGFLYAVDRHNRLWFRPTSGVGLTWTDIGQANDIVALASSGDGFLYAADRHNQLWIRQEYGKDKLWADIGPADHVVGLAYPGDACGGFLYAADSYNQLLHRSLAGWSVIGHANYVVGFAGTQHSNGCFLYAADSNNRLWFLRVA